MVPFFFLVNGMLCKICDDYYDEPITSLQLAPYKEYLQSFSISLLVICGYIDYHYLLINAMESLVCFLYDDIDNAYWASYVAVNLFLAVLLFSRYQYDLVSLLYIMLIFVFVFLDVQLFRTESGCGSWKKQVWRMVWFLISVAFTWYTNNTFAFYYTGYALGYGIGSWLTSMARLYPSSSRWTDTDTDTSTILLTSTLSEERKKAEGDFIEGVEVDGRDDRGQKVRE